MNEQLKRLIELQKLDSSIISIAEKIESLPGKLEKPRALLKESTTSFQKIKTRLEEINRRKKDKDLELEEVHDKINKLKSKSSEIKTNREYEAHLKEIETFEKKKFQVEDELLSLMEEGETLTGDSKTEELRLKKAEEDFRQHEKLLEEEKKGLYQEMEMYKTKRKDFVAQIDEEIYEQYMSLLKRFGGLAVVKVENEVCLGCNTNVPPQLYNDIKETENIYTCYYCKRFLYY